ncbi:hypothetical protein [Paenibacillus massiliensis]
MSYAQLDRAMLSHCELRHCNFDHSKLIVNMDRRSLSIVPSGKLA